MKLKLDDDVDSKTGARQADLRAPFPTLDMNNGPRD